jgi:hypothetical protein
VDKVADVSIARQADVQVGDMLVLVDGTPAADVDLAGFVQPDAQHRYEFYSPARQKRGSLLATGAPLGVSLSASTETLEKKILSGARDIFKQMLLLWDRGAWDVLEGCAGKFVNRKDLDRGFLQRLLDFFGGMKARSTPAVLMLGAALYEQGRREEGLRLVQQFREKPWTMDFMGLRRYYFGRDALEHGNKARARALLEEAFQYHPCNQTAELLEQLTGQRPSSPRGATQNKAFPVDYQLPEEQGTKKVSFAETLRGMTEPQLLVLCLLGPYRTNGPYHDFLRSYCRLAVHFPDYLAPMHIVTEDCARKNHRPEFIENWLRAEKQARRAQVPFRVLDDRQGKVNAVIAAQSSPFILVVNARGKVVHEGLIDEVQWWDLLAATLADAAPGGPG